ncbi:glycosyltransferase family 8 protein [Streptomyces sp. NPDC051173]|uniref:glycosyltransferase family 8 protein n=1 Tax=Streptomyces sp. NPDC051173 TaxID=3155164 RepID=UPI003450D7A2
MTRPCALPPIVCGVDASYVVPLRALMSSLVTTHAYDHGDLRLIVLHDQLPEAARADILRHARQIGLSTQLRAVPAAPVRGPVSGWVSEAVYLRLSIAEVIGDERVVLYLDADTLVLRSLRPLLRHQLGGAPLAAVRDPQNPVLGRGIALPGWDRLGLPAGREYFNSGVMLIDLSVCRERGLFERARRFLAEHPGHARFWDQDALNWAAEDTWLRLDRRWNTFALSSLASQPGFVHHAEEVMPLATLLGDESRAAVLHFAGPDKPWKAGYPAAALADLYQQHLPATTGGPR